MLPAPLYSLFQVKVDYSTLGASNQFLYRTSKSRQTNREKDNDSPNKITKAHNSTFTRVILTLKKHKSTASGPAFCQVSGGAFLKSVIKSAIFSGFGQKVRAHILITIVSKYASLHGAGGGTWTRTVLPPMDFEFYTPFGSWHHTTEPSRTYRFKKSPKFWGILHSIWK